MSPTILKWKRFLRDEQGVASSFNLILAYAILAFGAVVGLSALRDQVVQEYGDMSVALERMDQSYRVDPIGTCPGYEYLDTETLRDRDNQPPGCISFEAPTAEGT